MVVACPARSGYFECGGAPCSRAIDVCSDLGCVWWGNIAEYDEIAPSCGPCVTCACLATSRILASCSDDGDGGITYSVRRPGHGGASCATAADCLRPPCQNGVCMCIPGGSPVINGTAVGITAPGCCSGYSSGTFSAATCSAYKGLGCTTMVPDCFGGPCDGGFCECVGGGGSCAGDGDCCSGTVCEAGTCH